VWIAKSYVALICLTPGAPSASALLPTFCRSSSLLTFVLRTYSHSFDFSGNPCPIGPVRFDRNATHGSRPTPVLPSTARKLPFLTTPMYQDLQALRVVVALAGFALSAGGRTTRAWIIPGRLKSCMYVNFPVTLSECRDARTGLPTIV